MMRDNVAALWGPYKPPSICVRKVPLQCQLLCFLESCGMSSRLWWWKVLLSFILGPPCLIRYVFCDQLSCPRLIRLLNNVASKRRGGSCTEFTSYHVNSGAVRYWAGRAEKIIAKIGERSPGDRQGKPPNHAAAKIWVRLEVPNIYSVHDSLSQKNMIFTNTPSFRVPPLLKGYL